MMNLYILSIGLNRSGETMERATQLDETLQEVRTRFGPVLAVAMLRGEWQGIAERTIQIAVRATRDGVARGALHLAHVLGQDAVAVILPNGGVWTLYGEEHTGTFGALESEYPVLVDLAGVPE